MGRTQAKTHFDRKNEKENPSLTSPQIAFVIRIS